MHRTTSVAFGNTVSLDPHYLSSVCYLEEGDCGLNNNHQYKLAERAAWLSIIAYILLAAVKITVSLWFHSNALLADGLNNSTDVFVSVAILIGLRISRKPPDHDHAYGHLRAETVASLIASFIIAGVGIQVIIDTIREIAARNVMEAPDMITAWTALVCAAAIYAVSRYNLRIAKRIDSQAVHAAAMDNRSDALVSLGAFIGIAGAQFGMPWLDPLTALIVGILICKTAWDIFRESTHRLTDGFDSALLREYRQTIKSIEGVRSVRKIRARVLGNEILVDAVICLTDNNMNVHESHTVTEQIEKLMSERHRVAEVHIHIEPK